MDQNSFVDSLINDIVKPGLQSLMQTQYFSALRQGTLSIRRLQGFALQHYITNIALNKGFALCMVKYAHDAHLYEHFAYQYNEEQYHPDLVKRFGLALDLKEEDFEDATFIFECLSHTGAALRGMLAGSPGENRTWALVNESISVATLKNSLPIFPRTISCRIMRWNFSESIGRPIRTTLEELLRS
jgi:hypothetical protein